MAKIKQEIKSRALEWIKSINNDFTSLSGGLRDKWLDWYAMYRTFENQEKFMQRIFGCHREQYQITNFQCRDAP